MSKLILGLHCGYSHDSGIALLKDGAIMGCMAEERVSRVKKDPSFPRQSIVTLLKYLHVTPDQIDAVAVGACDVQYIPAKFARQYFETGISYFNHEAKKTRWDTVNFGLNRLFGKRDFHNVLKESLIQLGFKKDITIAYVDHHAAHMASALHTSGLLPYQETYIVTMDAYGDGKAISVYHYAPPSSIRCVYSDSSCGTTPGQAYSQVTRYLGMKINRHEGKVTGLAGYGKKVNPDQFRRLICFNETKNTFKIEEPLLTRFQRKLSGKSYYDVVMTDYFRQLPKEDIASIIQSVLESETKKFFQAVIPADFKGNILLAGGVFANVCLNYRLAQMYSKAILYVHPGMSDEGVALGAALHVAQSGESKINRLKLKDVYLGASYDQAEVKKTLAQEGTDQYHVIDRGAGSYEKLIAELLDYGAVIGLCDGRMEYGPRALGNRTILIHPRDASINKTVNQRLNRTEYMPFAPVVLEEQAANIFEMADNIKIPCLYMTIITDVKPAWRNKLAGVTHVDGTARPQTINRQTNSFYYDIVREFYHLTGIPVLVNTSFNLHEEPIIEHPQQALSALQRGAIDGACFKDVLVVDKKYWEKFLAEYKVKGAVSSS